MLLAGISQIGETQPSFSFRQRDAVETVRIGGFGRRSVGHVSTDSELPAYGFGGRFL